jgi:hypothetical protein
MALRPLIWALLSLEDVEGALAALDTLLTEVALDPD